MTTALNIWTNATFPADATERLTSGVQPHRLLQANTTSSLNLVSAPPDTQLEAAEIAFGQPDVEQLFNLPRLRWVHLTTAGYTAYDRDDLRQSFRQRGIVMTNSSQVYAEPCAQHALAMLLANARQLLACYDEQRTDRPWGYVELRERSFLLNGQSVLIYGYGAIAKRLCELLAPLNMQLTGVRRQPRGDESIPTVPLCDHLQYLPTADHVINILPASPQTRDFFDRELFARMQPHTHFYNIGRGTTVNQDDLVQTLTDGHLAGAYLDVTDPEPLPPDHPLWTVPRCHITPHTAGGFREEMVGLVQHFLDNLQRFNTATPLVDRII